MLLVFKFRPISFCRFSKTLVSLVRRRFRSRIVIDGWRLENVYDLPACFAVRFIVVLEDDETGAVVGMLVSKEDIFLIVFRVLILSPALEKKRW